MPDFDDCLRQIMAIRGTLRAALIDHCSGMTVAAVGRGGDGGDPDDRDDGGGAIPDGGPMDLVRATVASSTFVAPATPGYVEDIVVTAPNGYHLIHFLVAPFDARLVLYVWLDRLVGNLAMTQRTLHGIGRELAAA